MQKPMVLVLLDLEQSPAELLESAAVITKKVDGRLQALHIRMPIEAIEQANQFSAKKEFYAHYQNTKEQLEPIIEKVSIKEELPIDYSLIYGHVGNQIAEAIHQKQPDIVVLGKRKTKLGGLLGDRVTKTVLNTAPKSIYIVNTSAILNNFEGIAVGILEDTSSIKDDMLEAIVEKQNNKINFFGIGKSDKKTMDKNPEDSHYIFPENNASVSNMASYIKKTKTQLFCISKNALEQRESFARRLLPKLSTNVLLV